MNADKALALVKSVGIYGLAGTDGCLCMSCAVQGVSIDVSCRKSASGIPGYRGTVVRVWSRHLDFDAKALQVIADEVVLQISEETQRVVTRLCEWRIDESQLCAYCEKPREDAAGYLCNEHLGVWRV